MIRCQRLACFALRRALLISLIPSFFWLQAHLRRLADEIAAFSRGPVYPSNVTLGDHFVGQWAHAGPFQDRTVHPLLTPNISLGYAGLGKVEPAARQLDFDAPASGALRLQLVSLPILAAVPSLQRIDGVLSLSSSQSMAGFLSSSSDDASQQRADVPLSGLYIADQGVLAMTASPRKTEVFILEKALLERARAEQQAQAQQAQEAQPEAAGAAPPANATAADGASSGPAASTEPAPAAEAQVRLLQGEAEPTSTPYPTVQPAADGDGPVASSALSQLGQGVCEIMFVFRMRPIGWNGGEQGGTEAAADARALAGSGGSHAATAAGGSRRRLRTAASAAANRDWRLDALSRQVQASGRRGTLDWFSGRTAPSAAASTALVDRVLALQQGPQGGEAYEASLLERVLGPPAVRPTYSSAAAAVELGSATGAGSEDPLLSRQRYRTHAGHASRRTTAADGPARGLSSAAGAIVAADVLASASLLEVGGDDGQGAPAAHAAATAAGSGRRRLESAPVSALYRGARYIPLYGKAVSHNCNFTLNITAAAMVWDQALFEDKAVGYSLMATTSGVILMAVVTYQIVRSTSQSAAARISLGTIGMQAALDAYLTLVHVIGGLATPAVFSSFLTAAFVFLMLFAVLEMRFMLLVWKARRPEAFTSGWDAVRREVGLLYCRFYALLMLGLLLVWAGSWTGLRALAFLAFSFWLPQIVHSVQHDSRPGLAGGYVVTTALMRMLLPLYFLGCPNNLVVMLTPAESRAAALQWTAGWSGQFEAWLAPLTSGAAAGDSGAGPGHGGPWQVAADTSYAFASPAAAAAYWSGVRFLVWLSAWVLLQSVVVLLQGKLGWGPRWFVPYVFLPQRYDYHRKVAIREGRILPDHAACHAWLRPRQQQQEQDATAAAAAAAAAAGAAGGGAAAAPTQSVGQRMGAAVARYRQGAVERARFAYETVVWFGGGLRLLGQDWWRQGRRWLAARGSSHARLGGAAGSGSDASPASTPRGAGGRSSGGLQLGTLGRRRGGYERLGRSSTGVPAAGGLPGEEGAEGGSVEEEAGGEDEGEGRVGEGGRAAAGATASPLPVAVLSPAGSGAAAGASERGSSMLALAEEGRAYGGEGARAGAGSRGAGSTGDGDEAAHGGAAPVSAQRAAEREAALQELVSPEDGGEAAFDCVVCMDTVTFPRLRGDYMVTPCSHIFHVDCLQPWLAQKLECPTCRLQLPEP